MWSGNFEMSGAQWHVVGESFRWVYEQCLYYGKRFAYKHDDWLAIELCEDGKTRYYISVDPDVITIRNVRSDYAVCIRRNGGAWNV